MRVFYIAILVVSIVLQGSAFAQDAQVPQQLLDEKQRQTEGSTSEHEEYLQKIQPKLAPEDKRKKRPYKKYSEIPEEVLQEMQEFFLHCEDNRLLKSHYNCKCLAAEFLDERIRFGPNMSQASVVASITDKCIDYGAAAGYGLDRCYTYGGLNYSGGMTPDEYCECVSRNYAILWRNSKNVSMSSKSISRNMRSAILRCTVYPPGVSNPYRRLDQK